MSDALSQQVSRREFLIFLYKYRLRLLCSFLLPFLLCIAISFIPTPRYKANSVLIVRMGSEYVYQPEIGNSNGGPTSNIPLSNEQIFKSEVAILNSDDLHRQVVEAIGLEKLYPQLLHPTGLNLFMATLQKQVNAKLTQWGWQNDQSAEPESDSKRMTRAVELFDKHFNIILEKESAVINLSFEHKDSMLAQTALDDLVRLYFDKRKQLYLEPRSELAANETQSNHEKSLAAARAVEAFKRRRNIYSLTDQRSILLRQRDEAQQQSQAITNPVLEQKIINYNRQLDQLDADERQLNVLQKEADITANAYSLYSSKLDEAKAYDKLQRNRADSVRVIQPATVQSEPRKLQPLIILGGFFVSLMCMLLVAALTEFARSGFYTPEQIERNLGIPVLAAIPLRKRWWWSKG